MKKLFYFLGNIVAIFIAFLLYGVVQGFYFYPGKYAKALHLGMGPYIALTLLITVLALLLLFWLYRRQLAHSNNWNFNVKPHWNGSRLLIAFIGFVLLIVASTATQALLKLGPNTTSTNQAVLTGISRQAGMFFIPVVAIIAPLFEETIFRGLIFNTFFEADSPLSKWLGIILSGFVFGYIHDPALSKYIFVYWALGMVLAWVYTTTKDLRYSMIAHMLYNSLGFLG